MNTGELESCLSNYSTFDGVYALDELKHFKPRKHTSIVINLDPSNLPGSHWVAIHFGKTAYYFDSYGLFPLKREIVHFLDRYYKGHWTYNRKWIQPVTSKLCGLYCSVFVLFMHKKLSMSSFLSRFKVRERRNDCIVKHIFRKHIKCAFAKSFGQCSRALHNDYSN